MSLAMEKTRSLQQLFTSRFPRDFTGVQTVARPQAQVQPMNQAEMQTQTVKVQQCATPVNFTNQPPADPVKAATVQSRVQTQTVKAPPTSVQQKTATTSNVLTNTSRETQSLKQTSESQSQSSQGLTHPPAQTHPWTTQAALRSTTQTETSAHFARGSAAQCLAQPHLSSTQHTAPQQPPWCGRGLTPTNQLKPTAPVSATSSATPVQLKEREANVQETEASSFSGRRAVSDKAAFLERRAEWMNTSNKPVSTFMFQRISETRSPINFNFHKCPLKVQSSLFLLVF